MVDNIVYNLSIFGYAGLRNNFKAMVRINILKLN